MLELIHERTKEKGRHHNCTDLRKGTTTMNAPNETQHDDLCAGEVGDPVEMYNDPGKQALPEVIVIDDDNDDEKVENYDFSAEGVYSDNFSASHDGSSELHHLYHSKSDWCNTPGSELSDGSDNEDCLLMVPGPSRVPRHSFKRLLSAKKRPVHNLYTSCSIRDDRRSPPCSSNDCEIIEDADGKILQEWEEAAFRRHMGSSADSEVSTSALNQMSKKQKSQQVQEQPKTSEFGSDALGTLMHAKLRRGIPVELEQQDSTPDCLNTRQEDGITFGQSSSTGNESTSLDADLTDERMVCEVLQTVKGSNPETSSSLEVCKNLEKSVRVSNAHIRQGETAQRIDTEGHLVTDGEMCMKLTGSGMPIRTNGRCSN